MNEPIEPISTELLYAYVDGEVDSATRARIEAALVRDALLAARVARQRALRARLQGEFAHVAEEPVPDRLLQSIQPSSPVSQLQTARDKRAAKTAARSWSWREWSAMAATLVLGLLIATVFHGGGASLPLTASNGQLIATGDLRTALSGQLSQSRVPGGTVQVTLSIRTADGGVCRSFAFSGQAGLACRKAGDWEVEVLTAAPAAVAGDNYRQAASTLPDSLRVAIEARAAGDPLTPEEETTLRQSGWSTATGK